MNPISEILKLFKEGKILQQWEMYVLGNTELPRRAQTLDDNAVKDMIDKTLAECSILCGEVNKFLQYADFLLGKVQEVVKQDNPEKEKTHMEMQKGIESKVAYSKFDSHQISVEIQKMLTSYLIIDQYCIVKNMKSAIIVSELDYSDEAIQVSSLVDDTFYIVRNAYDRSLLSLYEFGVCATTNHLKMALEDFLFEELSLICNGDIIYTDDSRKAMGNGTLGSSSTSNDDGMTDHEKHLENEWSKAMQDFLDDDEDDGEAHGSANSPRLINVKKAGASTHIISLKGTGSRKKKKRIA